MIFHNKHTRKRIMSMKRMIAALAILIVGILTVGFASPATAVPARNVECNGTLLAGTFRNVTVPEGASCTIGPDVTILGNFRATKSPGVIAVNTNIGRNFMVAGATGSVRFGPDTCLVDPRVGNNLKIRNSNNVAVCEAYVENNLSVTGSTGRVMVRDNVVCNNLRVVRNDVLGLRVLRNRFVVNLDTEPNTVQNQTVVRDNVDLDGSPQDCRRG